MITDNGASGTLSGTVITVGSGIVDAPILSIAASSSNNTVFAFAGTGTGTHNTKAVVVQSPIPLTGTVVTADVGLNGSTTYSGAFDNNYFGGSPSTGFLYVCGTSTAATTPALYRIGFGSYPTMGSPSGGPLTMSTSASATCAPLTEIFNTNTSHDWLFASVTTGCQNGTHSSFSASNILTGSTATGGCIRAFEITSAFPSPGTSPNNTSTSPPEPSGETGSVPTVATSGGTSGIIIDNVSTSAQASSLYFGTLSGNSAVKLTQSQLQ